MTASASRPAGSRPISGLGWNRGCQPDAHFGDTIFAGGAFQRVDGAPRRFLVAIDATTGAVAR